ncbi:unnamed protein product, partial [Ectocarpus sp. 12 AP-2014]
TKLGEAAAIGQPTPRKSHDDADTTSHKHQHRTTRSLLCTCTPTPTTPTTRTPIPPSPSPISEHQRQHLKRYNTGGTYDYNLQIDKCLDMFFLGHLSASHGVRCTSDDKG